MKNLIGIAAALALTGCATPAELRATATPVTQWSAQNSRDHANCLARRMTNAGGLVTLLPGAQADSYEITMRAPRAYGTNVAATVTPLPSGSNVVYYVTGSLDAQNIANVFAKAC